MIRNFFLGVLPLLLVMCACGSNSKQITETRRETDPSKPIVAAITRDMPGYFIVGGERYGYPYELLTAYAADRNREFQLQTGLSTPTLYMDLRSGRTNIIVSLAADAGREFTESIPLYSTKYVVLAAKKDAKFYDGKVVTPAMLSGRMIMMPSGFENTTSYDTVLDSLSSGMLYVASRDGIEMAGSLSRGEFDLLICERSEALLAENLLQNVVRVYEFDEDVPVSLVFDSVDESLVDDFNQWLSQYKETKDYASLNRIYLERGFGSRLPLINKPNRVVGGISVWDDLIREVGEKEGVDWRLLSAIAYNESRFRTDVVSHRGAKGLMQIMPVTAQHFNMEDSDLHDPKTSLTIGAKLIKSLENILGFDTPEQSDDKLNIILAAYNSGIGTVTTARRLATSHGEDCDSWGAVSKYLVLMGDEDFASEKVTYRPFRGSGETLAFVDKVRQKYDEYCIAIQ